MIPVVLGDTETGLDYFGARYFSVGEIGSEIGAEIGVGRSGRRSGSDVLTPELGGGGRHLLVGGSR